MSVPAVTYLRGRSGSVAIGAIGEGPTTVVVVPGVFAHVDRLWEDPGFSLWMRLLAGLGRVVTYDPRGLGASDPGAATDEVAELSEVLDWCGSDVWLLGWFSGSGLAVELSSHPLVRGVVLVAPYGRVPDGVLDGWGSGAVGARLCPSDASSLERWRTLETSTAAPAAVSHVVRRLERGEVTATPSVRTLNLMPTRSVLCNPRFDVGSVEFLDTADVLPWGDSARDVARAIVTFVGAGAHEPVERERVLGAVMVTDIVGSTSLATSTESREWKHRLETHDAVVRARLEAHCGRFGRHTGDGCISTFSRVSDALRCAFEVAAETRRVGLAARVGVHVGEFDLINDVPQGVVVRATESVGSAGGAGDVVLSASAREALAGMLLETEPLGARELPTGSMALFRLLSEPPSP